MLTLTLALAHASPPSGAQDLSSDFHAEIEGAQTWNGYDQLGHALATGDLNGDGHLDLVMSAYRGEFVHIRFGPLASGYDNVANSDAYFQGLTGGGEAGWAVAVGDLTGDGQDDLIVSEPVAKGGAGQVAVVAGPLQDGGTWYDINSPEVAFVFEGVGGLRPWYAAWEMAVGDFDGDGSNDLALGICAAADEDPELGDPQKRPLGLVALVTSDDMVPASQGHTMLATDSTSLVWGMGSTGCAIDNAGDTNGDGIDDIVVGSYQLGLSSPNIPWVGAATVIEGREGWQPVYRLASYLPTGLTLSVLPGFYTLTGPASSGQQVGWSVAGAGDVNGDGLADFLVGGPGHRTLSGSRVVDAPTSTEGKAYLVYGAPDGSGLVGNSELQVVAGAVFEGSHDDHLGIDVSGAPDMDTDDAPELLVGGLGGAGYLFLGTADPTDTTSYTCTAIGGCTAQVPSGHLSGTLDLSAAQASFSGASSVNQAGSPGNFAGKVLLGSGDLTGSGTPSIIIGAPAVERYGPSNDAGHVYVIETP
ncbi:MAG: VCBS repeat-containing protein [Myxococcales bacterium]|nr:VCBS repeat-containing protein [Myxococcales bacterium]